ncbi:MAG: hypothetical protein ACRD0U_07820 [Acidimicrobiales bacterium]
MTDEIKRLFLDGETLNASLIVSRIGCSPPLFSKTVKDMRSQGHRFEVWWDKAARRNQYKLKSRPARVPTLEERVARIERVLEHHRLDES